jgi:hypothetical protein
VLALARGVGVLEDDLVVGREAQSQLGELQVAVVEVVADDDADRLLRVDVDIVGLAALFVGDPGAGDAVLGLGVFGEGLNCEGHDPSPAVMKFLRRHATERRQIVLGSQVVFEVIHLSGLGASPPSFRAARGP